MKIKVHVLVSLIAVLCPALAGAQTITAPNTNGTGVNAVASANDFATKAFQDPWDMNQRTDFGWFLHSVDQPPHGFTSFNFTGGLFTGTTPTTGGFTDPNLFLLETGFFGAAPLGKIGTNFPINTAIYKTVAMRMRLNQPSSLQLFASATTIFEGAGLQLMTTKPALAGWAIYMVDLSAVSSWTGTKGSLRLDPTVALGDTVVIDWVRLVDNNPALNRDIKWTPTGTAVDIYLSRTAPAAGITNPDALNGGILALNQTGGTYPFNAGALEPGDWWVAMRPANTGGAFVFSPGFYRVNAPATITVTAPGEEGSSDDFATNVLGNPWDMNSLADRDQATGVSGETIAPVTGAVTEAGTPVPQFTAYHATNTPGVHSTDPCASQSDPIVYLMQSANTFRGFNFRINPDRYRILTAELGLPNKARDICGGSIARIVWHVAGQINGAGQGVETVSDDIVMNSRADATVVNKINVDMKTLAIEPGSPNQIGWVAGSSSSPGIDGFRIDPHEFENPTPFFIKRVKLAALESANTSYTVQWTTTKPTGTVHVYFDDDKDPSVKTEIAGSPVAVTSTSGSLLWNTSALVQNAEYFIMVEYTDGINTNSTYSKFPVKIDHNPPPSARITLNRTSLNFGIAGAARTPAQTVRLTVSNSAAPQNVCWTVSSDLPSTTVSPDFGCGSGTFTVTSSQNNNVQGAGFATLTVSSAQAINSPQFVRANFNITFNSTPPQGFVDTPVSGSTVNGSVGFTGWAVDDIGIASVSLCRNAVAGENIPAVAECGFTPGEVFLGNAVSIDDARPDVEAGNTAAPLNYRAGWGFLVLTNMLPSQGNGTFNFKVRAFDLDGHGTVLTPGSGNPVITLICNNAASELPFGAIDTPAQGATIEGTDYVNFGWALTPQPKEIPMDGSTIHVFIDSVPIGTVSYNHARADIQTLFPGLRNTNGAIGLRHIDTTTYANGVHTIEWSVSDNQGQAAGIGSRFFSIFNTSGAITSEGDDLGRAGDALAALPVRTSGVQVRRGLDLAASLRTVAAGVRDVGVWHVERDRVEVHLGGAPGGSYEGYLVKNGRLAHLPIGSTLIRRDGVFAWLPAAGFIGRYDFLFVRTGADGRRERVPVHLVLESGDSLRRASARVNVPREYRALFTGSLD